MDCTFGCSSLLPLRFPRLSFKKASKRPDRLADNKGGCVSLARFIRQAILATLLFFLLPSLTLAAEVALAWDANYPAPDGYRVYARAEGQDYDYASPVWPGKGDDPTQTSCTLKGLADDTSYYFVVRAYVGSEESGDSNEVNRITGTDPTDGSTNRSPAADAGPDQVVDGQSVVTLNGANSSDSDDGIAAFEWRQVKGTSVALSACCEEIVTFTAPDVDTNGEALEFELAVTDFSGARALDRCIVNVTWVNKSPNADAGDDQSVREGTTVVLSAADSVDPDDGIVVYQWDQIQGPEVTLSNSLSSAPEFTAPDVGPDGATLKFQLTVTDAGGLQDTDNCTVNITWENSAPVADAGLDQRVAAGDEVELDGSQSLDPDGSDLNYRWRQTLGPPVTLSDATAVRPLFSVPLEGFDDAELTFELTVTDSGGLQGMDTCKVNVLPIVHIEMEQRCVTADNRDHQAAGRAYGCGQYWFWHGDYLQACAVGSGDNLGYAMRWYSQTTSLQETSPGYWERVPGCP